jgi:hypothetical protein
VQQPELVEQPGLTGPVPGLAGRDQGGLILARGLVPVTAGAQEAAHRGGDGDGVQRHALSGGVAHGQLQIGPLGIQPDGGLSGAGQLASASAGSTGACPAVYACSGRKNCPSGNLPDSRCAACTANVVLPMPAIPST